MTDAANLADHDSFVTGVPHATFKTLRATDPLHWTPAFAGAKGFWSFTRHADVVAANRDPETYSSAQGIRIEDQSHEEYMARRTFQETDGREHFGTRRVVNPAFAKPVIAGYEDVINDLARDIVTKALEQSEFDAVDAIAKQLPMMMLGRILGVPDSDLDFLVTKGDALIGNTDPDFSDAVLDKVDTDAYRMMPFRSPAGVELYDYADQILDGTKPVSKDGVLARLMTAETPLSALDFKNFFCLLVAAGNDTTRYSIAMALHLISQDNSLLEQLKDPAILDTAPDEFIRLAAPTLHFRRTATCDVEMHGKTIKKGDKVLLWFVSANYDETVFENPHEVRLDRPTKLHMSFGQGGPHVCLGMWLARLELRAVLRELAATITYLEPLEPPTWTRSNFICGVKKLNVRITK